MNFSAIAYDGVLPESHRWDQDYTVMKSWVYRDKGFPYNVYALCAGDTGEIFYIGKGSKDRVAKHFWEAGYSKGKDFRIRPEKNEAFKLIRERGSQVKAHILVACKTSSEAEFLERCFIHWLTHSCKANLVNDYGKADEIPIPKEFLDRCDFENKRVLPCRAINKSSVKKKGGRRKLLSPIYRIGKRKDGYYEIRYTDTATGKSRAKSTGSKDYAVAEAKKLEMERGEATNSAGEAGSALLDFALKYAMCKGVKTPNERCEPAKASRPPKSADKAPINFATAVTV